jgi:hypothetical protein
MRPAVSYDVDQRVSDKDEDVSSSGSSTSTSDSDTDLERRTDDRTASSAPTKAMLNRKSLFRILPEDLLPYKPHGRYALQRKRRGSSLASAAQVKRSRHRKGAGTDVGEPRAEKPTSETPRERPTNSENRAQMSLLPEDRGARPTETEHENNDDFDDRRDAITLRPPRLMIPLSAMLEAERYFSKVHEMRLTLEELRPFMSSEILDRMERLGVFEPVTTKPWERSDMLRCVRTLRDVTQLSQPSHA